VLGWILLTGFGCFVLERAIPGWELPRVKTWWVRVLAVNAVQLGVVVLAGVTWEAWPSIRFIIARSFSRSAGGGFGEFQTAGSTQASVRTP